MALAFETELFACDIAFLFTCSTNSWWSETQWTWHTVLTAKRCGDAFERLQVVICQLQEPRLSLFGDNSVWEDSNDRPSLLTELCMHVIDRVPAGYDCMSLNYSTIYCPCFFLKLALATELWWKWPTSLEHTPTSRDMGSIFRPSFIASCSVWARHGTDSLSIVLSFATTMLTFWWLCGGTWPGLLQCDAPQARTWSPLLFSFLSTTKWLVIVMCISAAKDVQPWFCSPCYQ